MHWRHRFAAVDVMRGSIVHINGDTRTRGGNCTEVLERCPCGAVRTYRLDGHWTLSQITGRTTRGT